MYVNLNEVQNYTPTDESFLGSVGAAFAQGWSNFVNGLQQLAVWLAGAWPVVLVVAAAAAGFAVWRKKAEKVRAASPSCTKIQNFWKKRG